MNTVAQNPETARFARYPDSRGKRCGYRECACGIELLLANFTSCLCGRRRR